MHHANLLTFYCKNYISLWTKQKLERTRIDFLHLWPGLRSRVGFLTTLGDGFFCPTPKVQLDHFLHHTPKLGIPVEMVQFLMKLLSKQRILALYRDFHWVFVATKFLTAKLYSLYVKESEILERSESEIWKGRSRKFGKAGVGVGHFTSDSATLP